jgi:glycosyltransferase involved in cell wall biosynthesis
MFTVWQLDPAQLTPYYNIALCDALALAGCRVRYITSRYLYDDSLPLTGSFQQDELYFRGLEHTWLVEFPRLRRLLRGISYPLNHWQVLRQARRKRPDIIHIQWSRLPRFDRWLIGQVKSLDIPVVHTVHDIVPLYAPEASTDPLHAVYREVDAIIVHTEANRRDFLQIYPDVAPERLRVIPLIATPNTAIPADASRGLARQQLSLPDNKCVFLFFGSIRAYKGVDILLPAFAQASATHPDLHLVIAGRPETAEDKALVADALPHVDVYSGYIPYEDMWQYYMAADVVILPYRAITQSAALLSAMDFGRAVIVTDVGGLPESVDGNGWVVPKEDVDALAATMVEAASNIERVRLMGERSLALVQQKHSGPVIAKWMLRVYEEVLSRRQTPDSLET